MSLECAVLSPLSRAGITTAIEAEVEKLRMPLASHHPDTLDHTDRVTQTVRTLANVARFNQLHKREAESRVKIGQFTHLMTQRSRCRGRVCSRVERRTLILAARLHDVGKIDTPLEILVKQGPLTCTELQIIKRHPHRGVQLIRASRLSRLIPPDQFTLLCQLVGGHHPRYLGEYAPRTYPEWCMQLLLTVADIADANRHERAYKRPLTLDEVKEALLSSEELYGMSHELISVVLTTLDDGTH